MGKKKNTKMSDSNAESTITDYVFEWQKLYIDDKSSCAKRDNNRKATVFEKIVKKKKGDKNKYFIGV